MNFKLMKIFINNLNSGRWLCSPVHSDSKPGAISKWRLANRLQCGKRKYSEVLKMNAARRRWINIRNTWNFQLRLSMRVWPTCSIGNRAGATGVQATMCEQLGTLHITWPHDQQRTFQPLLLLEEDLENNKVVGTLPRVETQGKDFWYSNIPFRIRQQLFQKTRIPAMKVQSTSPPTKTPDSLNVFYWMNEWMNDDFFNILWF